MVLRLLLLVLPLLDIASAFQTTTRPSLLPKHFPLAAKVRREDEIRRKIIQLKREGRLKKGEADASFAEIDEDDDNDDNDSTDSDRNALYEIKIRNKLGDKQSKMLGIGIGSDREAAVSLDGTLEKDSTALEARIGALPQPASDLDASSFKDERIFDVVASSSEPRKPLINPDLFNKADDEKERSEDELVALVAARFAEKKEREQAEKERQSSEKLKERLAQLKADEAQVAAARAQQSSSAQLTTGIGGSFSQNETAQSDMYQPKVGTWGAFPRPRDISKAYGGGRRIGPGYSQEQETVDADAETRAILQRYREKAGIDVKSEREFASEINEALEIGSRSMQRGLYSNAVSALEKVTKYCSTNSQVGGSVYLELAMAYEAAGRTQEAIAVYKALTESRIERIKGNAKKLLYGIEAFTFMRDDVKASEFSRKQAKNTFIDTTGLANFAKNFDDVYNTAYIDLEGGFYKKLSENVVRSHREARQVLLRATDGGEQSRLKIVQALRSIARRFDDALQKEITLNAPQPEAVAVINGRPILAAKQQTMDETVSSFRADDFILGDADTMLENLDGYWRLQLLADKRGEGVKFFNKTESWQSVDVDNRRFSSSGPQGFTRFEQSGKIEFNRKRRILWRSGVRVTSGGVFTGLFGGKTAGCFGAIRAPQQIMSVDSVLLVTRGVPSRRVRQTDDDKDYFAVWRRVEPTSLQTMPMWRRR
ncbi:hypothetical protein MPSEU_000329300 [Mayamaea pseudoterrestris]|nr:hypothetical protein MPSEU_000329300 [Mayamaea pseudoterrestris]